MAVWCSLWSFGTFFPFWYVWTTKNLATHQVGLIFAYWAAVYFGHFLKIAQGSQFLATYFSGTIYVLILTKNGLGYIFCKLILSLWSLFERTEPHLQSST
jgi:hypothetical protein